MADAFSIKFDASDLNAALDQLADGTREQVRPAAQAGAQVLHDEVKRNVDALGRHSGRLSQAIYQAYSKDNSSEDHATYHVSWNYKRAPHGHLVEYGYVQTRKVFIGKDGQWHSSKEKLAMPKHVPAHPFLRPAYDSKVLAALQAAKARFEQGTKQVIAELQT
jgi:predicted transcriptional regulator